MVAGATGHFGPVRRLGARNLRGRWAWLGVGAIGVFTALATLLAHSWWTKTGIERFHDFNTFWEHVGLIGGLMLAAALAVRDRR